MAGRPIASAGQCSLSGGTPSSASIRSSAVNSLHSAIDRPKTNSDNIDPHAIVGPQPTVWYFAAATHLLRAGVDINTIRAWLGHVSLATTNVYAEVDLEMKARALATCEEKGVEPQKPWREDKGLMEFLRTL